MTAADIILIYPPVAKPCEPPAGIARLAGTLRRQAVSVRTLDANLEGMYHLLNAPLGASDAWTRRAVRSMAANLALLTGPAMSENSDRYRRAVSDLNRLLQMAGSPGVRVGLADYADSRMSPLRSADLLQAAARPEDSPFFPYFSRRLSGLLEKENPSLLGFSLIYLSQALPAFAMAGYLRRISPGTRLVLGGGLATSWMRIPGWQNPFGSVFDVMVAGPGEAALLEMAEMTGENHSGPPDYGDFTSNAYLSPGFVLPYSTSGGCYWGRCAFCPERSEGNPYRPLPSAQVVRELKALAATTRPALVHLLDNALSPRLLTALAADPPGAPWYGFARITAHLADPDFCRALRRSGCRMLQLGLESGDQQVLDSLDKGIDLDTAAAALGTLKQAGIATYVYLLFGTTAETQAEAERTLAFAAAHSRSIDFLNLAVFNLPAHGPEAERLRTSRFYEGDLSLYRDFRHPRGWHRLQVRRFLDREFKRHPAIAPILRRQPPVFTSNHAPFFCLKASGD